MAAGDALTGVIGAIGITAAVIVLLIAITGFLLLAYGIRHFDEWDEKW